MLYINRGKVIFKSLQKLNQSKIILIIESIKEITFVRLWYTTNSNSFVLAPLKFSGQHRFYLPYILPAKRPCKYDYNHFHAHHGTFSGGPN